MKAFLSLIGKQIRIGTLIALFGGGLLGLFLGTLLVSFENAQLLFEDISIRIHTIIFLASMCALISAALFFPLELGVACGLKIWPNLSKVSAKRFYLSSFVIGIALAHAFLWLNFNFVRNITSPKGIALSLGLFLAALGLLVTLIRIHSKSTAYNDAGPRAWFLACLIALFTGLSMISYHSLASHPKLSASATNATVSHETQSLTLTHSSSTRWNVILISIDTLRSDHLSCYGYSRQTAPHIDRLAKDGILFRNTRSQAPWTLPSHASMLTSLYPSSHGARFYSISRFLGAGTTVKLADRNVTLAEILQGAGCRTAAFTSVPWLSRTLGFGQGFDKIEMDVWAHTATTLVDKAIAWVGGSKTHPFFLFLHFMDVHNYTSPAEYDERYQNTNYNGRLKTQKLEIGANLYEVLSNDDLQYLVAKYDGALSYVDFELGRFFTWLRKTDQYDKTLIVITSDHGEEFWDHSGTGHGFTLYEDQLRVPLVIKLPAEFPIRDHEQHSLVGVIDIAPTVLDYLGIPLPPFFEGISLRPFIETNTQFSRVLFAGETLYFNSHAIIQNNIKYIENRIPPADLLNFGLLFANVRSFYKFHDNELYQIERDPEEKSNLLRVEPEIASRLKRDLLEHIQTAKVGQQVEIDEPTLRQLRSLGYIQ